MMTMPSYYKIATGGFLTLLLTTTGCQSSALTNNQKSNNSSTPIKNQTTQLPITQQALHIQRALANKNYASIVDDIHPTRGVRFSMYAYVRPESDKVFSRAQYSQYLKESKIRFTWGDWDGTGELLVIPLPAYLDTWIKANDFNNARITVNKFESRGSMINNVNNAYPNLDVVDFYYKGTIKYDGMDWRGMRLVFDTYQGKRYLVAIINDQWTV